MRFDLGEIRDAGYDPITPVIVANPDAHPVRNLRSGEVRAGESLFEAEG